MTHLFLIFHLLNEQLLFFLSWFTFAKLSKRKKKYNHYRLFFFQLIFLLIYSFISRITFLYVHFSDELFFSSEKTQVLSWVLIIFYGNKLTLIYESLLRIKNYTQFFIYQYEIEVHSRTIYSNNGPLYHVLTLLHQSSYAAMAYQSLICDAHYFSKCGKLN